MNLDVNRGNIHRVQGVDIGSVLCVRADGREYRRTKLVVQCWSPDAGDGGDVLLEHRLTLFSEGPQPLPITGRLDSDAVDMIASLNTTLGRVLQENKALKAELAATQVQQDPVHGARL